MRSPENAETTELSDGDDVVKDDTYDRDNSKRYEDVRIYARRGMRGVVKGVKRGAK